ncbi:MAG TPA: Na+/H+ antiporter NhaA, partial [Dehalococcoidia bacterium]|nr:Na+/H+ antiporter NhaA [Dehalococcoidia bacterium]
MEFVIDNSLLLVAGTVTALVWANLNEEAYQHFTHSLHFAVNDVGMVFFFALAAKEVYEATLPGGALSSLRQAAVPILAAIGGMLVPALVYVGLATWVNQPELIRGWAIPCATDIAFSYMTARIIFGSHHIAIPFLLLLAIADDALGLIILAVFYPTGEISLLLFVLFFVPALLLAWWLRRRRTNSFWPYVLLAGGTSWFALHEGGFHPALALVPIVPFMPHEPRDLGIFDEREELLPDTLNHFEHWWKAPVQVILFFFGLVNAGVMFSSVGVGTWIVLTALVVGKPVGIWLFTEAAGLIGFSRAPALTSRIVFVMGIVAGIGFTVSLFFSTAAFP